MQQELRDADTLVLLQSIDRKLARLVPPSFEELSQDEQRMLFEAALARTTLEEVYLLEATHPDLVARRRTLEDQKRVARVNNAKLAGIEIDTTLQDALKQTRTTLPMITGIPIDTTLETAAEKIRAAMKKAIQ